MSYGLASAIRDEIAKFLAPLSAAQLVPRGTQTLVQTIGHVGSLGLDPALDVEIRRVAGLVEEIAALDDAVLSSWEGIAQVVDLSRELMLVLRDAESVLTDPGLVIRAQDLGVELAEKLLALYLRTHHPALFRTAAALTLITAAERAEAEPIAVDSGAVNRLPWARDRFHFDRVPALFDDFLGVMKAEYLPGDMAGARNAHLAADRLFPLLRDLSRSLGVGSFHDLVGPELVPDPSEEDNEEGGPWPPENDMLEAPDLGPLDLTEFHRDHRPRFVVYVPGEDDGTPVASRLGLALIASSAEHTDGIRGYILAPLGEVNWSETRGSWRLELSAGASIPAFVVGPEGVELPPATTPLAGATAAFSVERIAEPDEPAFRFGAADGTRIEVGAFGFRTDLTLSATKQAIALTVEAGSGTLVLAANDDDGFLGSLLPKDGARIPFDLGLVLSSDGGLEWKGGVGLELVLLPHKSLGPVTIEVMHLALSTEEGDIEFRGTGSLGVKLGPLRVVVEDMGFHVTASFPPGGGSLGPVDLDAGVRWPSGAGISVDGGGFKGGGFLSFDPDNDRYTGVLQLRFRDKFVINAVGVLTTRLPDDHKGFSLLIIVSSEFSPVQLGLGFTLNGVGGLLGVNRTAKVDVLRAGLRDNTLDGLLFPTDPVEEAPRLIRDLERVFPGKRGRYLFGPVGKLGWGTPTLVTADIGLVLEVPEPVRLLFFGVLRAKLPKEEDKVLLRLQVNFLGEINFERKEFSFDAHLFDSRLAQFSLDGDMAVRINSGDDANLLLTVGGFHPGYTPPPIALPSLSRVQIKLLDSDNPNLRLEGYFAITSNTVQIGAAVELLAKANKFNVYGFIGFDGLFQLDPFRFVVLVSGTLAARIGTRVLFGVGLDMSLEGPAPWKAAGAAKIKFWFITIRVRFAFTFGDLLEALLDAVDLLSDLLEALADPGNWQTTLPSRVQPLVSMRDTTDESELILVQPMGFLQIAQKVVPLGLDVDRVGGARPTGESQFTLGNVTAQGTALATEEVREQFAPAQFFDLTDTERVSSKSFERYEAGVKAGEREVKANYAVPRDVQYERVIIDLKGRRERLSAEAQPLSVFEPLLRRSAAARSPLSAQARFASTDAPQVSVAEEGFTVVQIDDLRPADPNASKKSEQEARNHMRTLLRDDPNLAGTLQVVPSYEAEAA